RPRTSSPGSECSAARWHRVSISLNRFVPRSLTSCLPAISLTPRTCRTSTDTPGWQPRVASGVDDCQEGWSRLGERWRGVRLRTLLALAGAADGAGYATVGSGEYTAVLTR